MVRTAWLAALLAFVVAACEQNPVEPLPEPTPAVASVQVTPGELSLVVGDERTFTATVRAGDGSVLSDRTVAWTSTDGSVAEVTAAGVVTARSLGAARISATVEGRIGQAQVSVAVPTVERVELDWATLGLDEGEQRQLVATPLDQRDLPITGLGIQWGSSAPEIATVSPLGEVTAIRVGQATVTATVHGKSASVGVSVAASYPYDLLYTTTTGNEWGLPEVYRLDIRQDAGTPARLFAPETWGWVPKPSPDGSRIAFVCWGTFGEPAICVADRDGGDRRLVSWHMAEARQEPSWSPDGTRLAFVRTYFDPAAGETRNTIAVVDAAGGDVVTLTHDMAGDQFTPAWSPLLSDGTERIAFSSGTGDDRRIWTMRPDGTDRRPLTATPGSLDAQPAWSPDGSTLVFQRFDAHHVGDLWLVDAAGGDERPLGVSLPGPQVAPAWSPDGRLIAFGSSHETYAAGTLSYQIYTVWADGTKLARRSSGAGDKASPAWLPRS